MSQPHLMSQPWLDWQPIDKDPPKEMEPGIDPLILIAHFDKDNNLIWAMAAQWRVETYGYIHCASRSGWQADYVPGTATGADRPRKGDSFSWIFPHQDLQPTHWTYLPGLSS